MTSLTLAFALGCGGDQVDPAFEVPLEENKVVISPAHVVALSDYESSIGNMVEIYGTNFPSAELAKTYLVMKGTFTAQDGSTEAVDLESEVKVVDKGTGRWTNFGPYRNPFSASGIKTGTFNGSVAARVITPEGQIINDPEPTPIYFKVRPSILVTEFQPVTASCNGAIKRALGGASYRLSIQAIGFEPVSYTYSLAAPALEKQATIIRHIADGPFDTVGQRGDFQMPAVPDNLQSYGAVLNIQATDAEGQSVQSSFAISVHRPIEIFYNGNLSIAEVMAPVPVSGCLPGGEAGRSVVYSEAMQETRSRSYNVSWNEQWLSSRTVSLGSQQTVGLSETNGVGFATTDGESFNWSLGTDSSGKFDLAGLVELGVSVNAQVGGATSRTQSASSNRSQGVNAATTTTETESASNSFGASSGGSFSWQASSTETISKTFGGQVIAKTYGVFYRQTIRLMRRAAVVTYNQCGSANVVAELDFSDWTWAPDLALGESCPPFPESNLPSAQCLISPCSGK